MKATKTKFNLSALALAGLALMASHPSFADSASTMNELPEGTVIRFHVKGALPPADSDLFTSIPIGSYQGLNCSVVIVRTNENMHQSLVLDADLVETVRYAHVVDGTIWVQGDFSFNGIQQSSNVQAIECKPDPELTRSLDDWSISSFQQFIQSLGGSVQIPAPIVTTNF